VRTFFKFFETLDIDTSPARPAHVVAGIALLHVTFEKVPVLPPRHPLLFPASPTQQLVVPVGRSAVPATWSLFGWCYISPIGTPGPINIASVCCIAATPGRFVGDPLDGFFMSLDVLIDGFFMSWSLAFWCLQEGARRRLDALIDGFFMS
jgi:hypothetical protein